jgi:hypothetical protein
VTLPVLPAIVLQNLGYSGDIGYQTFLYSSEIDIRRVFVFLIEKLPKESGKSIVEPTGENYSLYLAACYRLILRKTMKFIFSLHHIDKLANYRQNY